MLIIVKSHDKAFSCSQVSRPQNAWICVKKKESYYSVILKNTAQLRTLRLFREIKYVIIIVGSSPNK